MPRKRMIAPEIWTDEGFIELSPMARLLFIGLISHADDEGRGGAGALAIKSKIFPADKLKDADIEKLKEEVIHKLRVQFYVVDGRQYYQLDRWTQHQYVQSKKPSTIPLPDNNIGPDTIPSTEEHVKDTLGVSPNRIEKNRKEIKKHTYADNVMMTEEEHGKLVAKYGADGTQRLIDKLNVYKGSSGKKYKSDYMAILNWVVDSTGVKARDGPPGGMSFGKCKACGELLTTTAGFCTKCGHGR